MADFRLPGPACTVLNYLTWVDPGTLCRRHSPVPGTVPSTRDVKKAKLNKAIKTARKAPPALRPVPTSVSGFLAEIKAFEGVVPHMYRDSKGYVTVGIGFLVENTATHAITDDGKKLPFVHRTKPANKATEAEIIADFDAVMKQPHLNSKGKAFAAGHYKIATQLDLSNEYIENRFNDLVAEFWGQLQQEFPRFDTFPVPVQFALLDMIFNLGRGREWTDKKSGTLKRSGIHQYQTLRKALDGKDWKLAGDASHRKGISPERNKRIKEWFHDGELHGQPSPKSQFPYR